MLKLQKPFWNHSPKFKSKLLRQERGRYAAYENGFPGLKEELLFVAVGVFMGVRDATRDVARAPWRFRSLAPAVKCNQPNVHPNVQDAFMNAMMPNGIWLKTGRDWLGRTKECLCDCVLLRQVTDPGWLLLFGLKLRLYTLACRLFALSLSLSLSLFLSLSLSLSLSLPLSLALSRSLWLSRANSR